MTSTYGDTGSGGPGGAGFGREGLPACADLALELIHCNFLVPSSWP